MRGKSPSSRFRARQERAELRAEKEENENPEKQNEAAEKDADEQHPIDKAVIATTTGIGNTVEAAVRAPVTGVVDAGKGFGEAFKNNGGDTYHPLSLPGDLIEGTLRGIGGLFNGLADGANEAYHNDAEYTAADKLADGIEKGVVTAGQTAEKIVAGAARGTAAVVVTSADVTGNVLEGTVRTTGEIIKGVVTAPEKGYGEAFTNDGDRGFRTDPVEEFAANTINVTGNVLEGTARTAGHAVEGVLTAPVKGFGEAFRNDGDKSALATKQQEPSQEPVLEEIPVEATEVTKQDEAVDQATAPVETKVAEQTIAETTVDGVEQSSVSEPTGIDNFKTEYGHASVLEFGEDRFEVMFTDHPYDVISAEFTKGATEGHFNLAVQYTDGQTMEFNNIHPSLYERLFAPEFMLDNDGIMNKLSEMTGYESLVKPEVTAPEVSDEPAAPAPGAPSF